jgi:hypothetical protein
MRFQRQFAELSAENGMLVYSSSYDSALVAALKMAIPASDRRWDPEDKVWLVLPRHAQALVDLSAQYLGVMVMAPNMSASVAQTETRLLDVRYIGATKKRAPGEERSAFGHSGGEWGVLFPEPVLLSWFGLDAPKPGMTATATLYTVLGVRQSASGSDVRSSYRRLARITHPDVNHEPDAHEQFIKLQRAYEVLSNPRSRARYDAGLLLEESAKRTIDTTPSWARPPDTGYKPPLRCGLILAEGVEQLGRFVVSQIIAWEDIARADGKILVTSWPLGADTWIEEWA